MSVAYSHFDLDHWLKVKAERLRQGIVAKTTKGEELPDHALAGKTVVDITSNTIYVVERVKKDWLQGWFLTAMLNCNGSHRLCIVENLSCHDEAIGRAVAAFQGNFRIQPQS